MILALEMFMYVSVSSIVSLANNAQYDGFPISELNVKEYRKQIGYVSKETKLYPGTLEFNIALGADGEVTQDDLEEACAKANILNFIEGLSKYVLYAS